MDVPSLGKEVRERLENTFPTFGKWLEEESIFYRNDIQGTQQFTECGLLMELIHFLDVRHDQWGVRPFQELADLLEEMLLSSSDTFRGAVEICFLETIGSYGLLADALQPHLKPQSISALNLS